MKSDILFIQFLKKGKVSRMLALSRKKDEAIIINDDVEVTVIEIKGDQVKLGITAPKSVPIYRKGMLIRKLHNRQLMLRHLTNSLRNDSYICYNNCNDL